MSNNYSVAISAPGTLVGATVSALVFTTITTTGDAAAAVTSTGIELTGNMLGYGAELIAGTTAANTIKTVAKTYSALAKPAIHNASRLGAIGLSLLAGTSAALATSAVVYGGNYVGNYLYSCIEDYKQKVANKIQHPVPLDVNVTEKDDIQFIEDDITI